MNEFVPDLMTYGKVAEKIKQLRIRLTSNPDINTYQDVAAELESTIAEIVSTGQVPITEYEQFLTGQPPSRTRMNEIMSKLESDFALIESQAAVTRAAAIFQFNRVRTEIKKNIYLNQQARDRLGVLQLYTNAPNENVVNFGSNLTNDSEFDKALIPAGESPSLIAPGSLTLGSQNMNINLTMEAAVKVLPGSNGFLGNNQELHTLVNEIPATAVGDEEGDESVEEESTDFTFKQNIINPKFLEASLDGSPGSWVEFEVYKVSEQDKASAGNFNFKYLPAETETRKYNSNVIDSYSYVGDGDVPWADGPFDGDTLKLNLQYDLGKRQKVNTVWLSYHGLENNVNEPFRVLRVDVSDDYSEWTTLREKDVWVASDASKAIARVGPNVSIGSAVWVFPELNVRYVRFYIEQPESIPVEVGHPYYKTRKVITTTRKEVADETAPDGKRIETTVTETGGDRVEGPNPPLDETDKYFGPAGSLLNNSVVRAYESFNARRWAIGIKDVAIRHLEYTSKSVFFTKSYKIDGVIDRVSLEADYYIPEDFGTEEQWIKFFVSPNDGLDWFQIARIQDDFLEIPEIIAFNDPIPEAYQDPNVGYREVDTVANNVKLKVELTRPESMKGKTPIRKSYNLKVQKR